MIVDSINQKIAEALKAHNELRVSTLRLLSSALNYEFIAKQHKLSEEEEIAVVFKEIKKRKEAIEAYEKASAQDRADKEKEEMHILEEFIPKQMSDEELQKIVEDAVKKENATAISDMGKVIGLVKSEVGSLADGGRIAMMVKNKLTQG